MKHAAVYMLFSALLAGTALFGATDDLTAVYKKGRLTLTPDPDFASGTDKVFSTEGGKRTMITYPLGEFLPYYCDLEVDALGNILVFKMSEDPKSGPIVIQVYSPAGKLWAETEIDRGGFDVPLNRSVHLQLDFTERGLFGLFPLAGDELETPNLFRVRLQP